ncbi:MAG: hypothetical protein HY775_04485 [Acidobacteria bacterium]|nr:hypothetical protein [Acidobacteriota bacterium]
MHLVCECCGYPREFRDADEAFEAGWDCRPYFSGPIICELCPSTLVTLRMTDRHERAHSEWMASGRPTLDA